MPLVTVAAEVYDLFGYFELETLPQSQFNYVERRVAVTKTLDGGVAVYDNGFAAADTVFELEWSEADDAARERMKRLVAIHNRVIVSTRNGVYRAVPERYDPGPNRSRLRLLATDQLSA